MASRSDSLPPNTRGALRLASDARVSTGVPAAAIDQVLSEPAPTSTPSHAEGDMIADKYRLIRKVGEGGMGAVWIAHNVTLDVPVAIKLIGDGREQDEHSERLVLEARAAAQLGHPAITRVFDFGRTEAGAPFIVMELLHGEDLAAVLERRGSISERRAVQTLLPVMHALAAAHDKGIVHRDLKPANIFLAQTDAGGVQPKLVDFGIAKLDTEDFRRLTRAGAILGSPAYMSPEQARGEDVDASADIWAVCVVLYEMIMGRPPFDGDNYNALLWAIGHDSPRPTSTQIGGDTALWAILERGLQKRKALRWNSMWELGTALAEWLDDRGVHEDIAGGSLLTNWLHRPVDSSAAFNSDSAPPRSAVDGALDGHPREFASTMPELPAEEIVELSGPPWHKRRGALLAVAGLALLLAAGSLLALLSRWGAAPTVAATQVPVRAQEVAAPSALPPVVAVASPQPSAPIAEPAPQKGTAAAELRKPVKPTTAPSRKTLKNPYQ